MKTAIPHFPLKTSSRAMFAPERPWVAAASGLLAIFRGARTLRGGLRFAAAEGHQRLPLWPKNGGAFQQGKKAFREPRPKKKKLRLTNYLCPFRPKPQRGLAGLRHYQCPSQYPVLEKTMGRLLVDIDATVTPRPCSTRLPRAGGPGGQPVCPQCFMPFEPGYP